jgi:hypothetical protein
MNELLKINVNDKVEKKNGLTYLSWAWAWAEVLKIDPDAGWALTNFGADGPAQLLWKMDDGTAMVGVLVKIKGRERSCVLPVMDHKNKAIVKPNAFDVNKAVMRCLAKAIAMHGLGLYIYAGEDLPEGEEEEKPAKVPSTKVSPTADAGLGLDEDRKSELENLALDMIEAHRAGDDLKAIGAYYFLQDNEDKLYLWKCLAAESKLRAILKANNPHKETAKT